MLCETLMIFYRAIRNGRKIKLRINFSCILLFIPNSVNQPLVSPHDSNNQSESEMLLLIIFSL